MVIYNLTLGYMNNLKPLTVETLHKKIYTDIDEIHDFILDLNDAITKIQADIKLILWKLKMHEIRLEK